MHPELKFRIISAITVGLIVFFVTSLINRMR